PQSKFYRIWPMPRDPSPNKMRGEQNRHKNGCAENDVLAKVYKGRRNERPATQVVSVQRVAQPVWRKRHCSGEPDHTHREIEPARKRIERSRFGVVNAAKPVGLHQAVPDAPEENHQQNSFEVPPEKSHAYCEEKKRRKNEAPLEAIKQSPVAVRPYHARQVMTHRTEGRDKEINILRTPLRLGQRKGGYQQQRR